MSETIWYFKTAEGTVRVTSVVEKAASVGTAQVAETAYVAETESGDYIHSEIGYAVRCDGEQAFFRSMGPDDMPLPSEEAAVLSLMRSHVDPGATFTGFKKALR